MAFLYKRADSPYWFLRRKNNDGKKVSTSTGLRIDSQVDTEKAELLRAEATVAEQGGQRNRTEGWDWVENWLVQHCKSPLTLRAYRTHWAHIQHFLTTQKLDHPSVIRFSHGAEYVEWRTGKRAKHKVCGKNTALLEVKLLGQIMKHAAKRGMCAANPIQSLGIAKAPVKQKRVLSDDELKRCAEALENEPEWMRFAFHIALWTGCRLRETPLKMKNVDFQRGAITNDQVKGGEKKAYSRPLPPFLVDLLQSVKNREYSHEIPFQPSRRFQQFFEKLKIDGVSFHCLRVTYVTKLHRAGVGLSAAMRLVNHSSEVVHRIYQRLEVADVAQYAALDLYPTVPRPKAVEATCGM